MIIRELVTLLRFDAPDGAVVDRYNDTLRDLAKTIAGLFAAHEIMETADQWNTVAGRVLNVTNSVSETTRVMGMLQKQAEETGQAFEGIGSLFAQLSTTGSSLNYTRDQVLELTNVISKLVTLGGGTAAGGRRGMIQIEEMFSIGTVQLQHLRALMIDIPGAVDMISASMEGGKKKFMEMVHAGTMTSKLFGDLFLKAQADIDRRFKNMPLTFARAFETVHSYFGGLLYDIGQATGVWTTLASGIRDGGKMITDTIRWIADEVGGFANELKLAGILLVAMTASKILNGLRTLALLVTAINLPWLLMAAAIALIGIALDDIYGWLNGIDSITGELLGPFSAWQVPIKHAKEALEAIWTTLGDLVKALGGVENAALLFVGAATVGKIVIGDIIELVGVRLVAAYGAATAAARGFNAAVLSNPALRALAVTLQMKDAVDKWTDENAIPVRRSGAAEGGPSAPPPEAPSWWQRNMPAPLGGSFIPDWSTPYAVPLGTLAGGSGRQSSSVTVGPVTVQNTINTRSDTPEAVGNAAASGTKDGLQSATERYLDLATPRAEFGLAH